MFRMDNILHRLVWMGKLLAGSLPAKQLRIVVGWLAIHEEEVYSAWNNAVSGKPFSKIEG